MGDQGEKGVGSLQGAGEQRAQVGFQRWQEAEKKSGNRKRTKRWELRTKGREPEVMHVVSEVECSDPPARDHPHIYL